MSVEPTTIVGILSAASAVGVAIASGWYARKTNKDSLKHPDWPAFAKSLETRVADQDRKIDELFAQLAELRDALGEERRRTDVLRSYIRRVLIWAQEALPDHAPPPPPEALTEELADIFYGKDQR